MYRPELVLPAGTLEKLKTAFLFGAGAVYLAGKEYGLRAAAGNLTLPEISEGLIFARQFGGRLYVTVNVLARNQDLHHLPAYLEELAERGVDGLIISDPGVLRLASRYAPEVPVTISTQASISNYEAAAFYRELGAKRLVLARELTLEEILAIKSRVDVEIEMFVHGAMCVSYSGRCLLSSYMTGRSANQGECAHPCRYRYALVEEKRPGEYFAIEEDGRGTYILNSRDLCLLEYVPQLIEGGIDAFKVEGRMKSPLYVASVARVYRQAIDSYRNNPRPYSPQQLEDWLKELQSTATRPFTTGFINGPNNLQDAAKQVLPRSDFCAVLLDYDPQRSMLEVEQRANFGPGDDLEWMLPGGEIRPFLLQELYDEEGNTMDRARHARQRVYIPYPDRLPQYSILRRRPSF